MELFKISLQFLTALLRLFSPSNSGVATEKESTIGFVWGRKREYKKLLQEGDRFDENSLFMKALTLFEQAIYLKPKSVAAYCRAANCWLKLRKIEKAHDYLSKAALYARNSRERMSVLIIRYQAFAFELDKNPSKAALERAHGCLEVALMENPKDIFLVGSFVVSTTYGLYKIKAWKGEERENLLKLAKHYFQEFVELGKIQTPYNQRYFHRLLDDIALNVQYLDDNESFKKLIKEVQS
jgi:tetratricopeptide (TPR) repeat protein